jgi:hypothetical protein
LDLALGLSIYAAAVSTLLIAVEIARFRREGRLEQREAKRDERQLTLNLTQALPTGSATLTLGDDWILQLTAANTGTRPVGVNGLALGLSDKRTVAGILPWPGGVRLPGVLQPGEHASTWWPQEVLREDLRREGVHLESAKANLNDGTTETQSLPANWQRFPASK